MSRCVCATLFAAAACAVAASADDKDEPKGERLKTILSVACELSKDKKTLTVTAVGQVPTGGWKGAKLVRRKAAPKDGIYEYDMTAVRPTGIVTQVISKVTAKDVWENPPADLKGVKVYGAGAGARTATVEM
jgi:hypothetical protein